MARIGESKPPKNNVPETKPSDKPEDKPGDKPVDKPEGSGVPSAIYEDNSASGVELRNAFNDFSKLQFDSFEKQQAGQQEGTTAAATLRAQMDGALDNINNI